MTVWIFKKWDIFGHQNTKMKKFYNMFSLHFSKILFDRHSKGSENGYMIVIFQDNFQYAQITPLWIFSRLKLTCFIHISCFIAYFFLIGLVLEAGVNGYSIHVAMRDVSLW